MHASPLHDRWRRPPRHIPTAGGDAHLLLVVGASAARGRPGLSPAFMPGGRRTTPPHRFMIANAVRLAPLPRGSPSPYGERGLGVRTPAYGKMRPPAVCAATLVWSQVLVLLSA